MTPAINNALARLSISLMSHAPAKQTISWLLHNALARRIMIHQLVHNSCIIVYYMLIIRNVYKFLTGQLRNVYKINKIYTDNGWNNTTSTYDLFKFLMSLTHHKFMKIHWRYPYICLDISTDFHFQRVLHIPIGTMNGASKFCWDINEKCYFYYLLSSIYT